MTTFFSLNLLDFLIYTVKPLDVVTLGQSQSENKNQMQWAKSDAKLFGTCSMWDDLITKPNNNP